MLIEPYSNENNVNIKISGEVSERIVVEFCSLTKTELSKIMVSRRTEIDVKLLLYAINKTCQFEDLLGKRFNGSTLPEVNTKIAPNTPTTPKAVKEEKNLEEKATGSEVEEQFAVSPFSNLIGAAFKV